MEDERILSFQEYDFVFLRCAIWFKKERKKKSTDAHSYQSPKKANV